MPSKFPVLRVPHVVLTEIVNQIELADLMSLSLCSESMFLLVQFHRTNMRGVSVAMCCRSKKDYFVYCYWKNGKDSMKRFLLTSAYNVEQCTETTETVKIANECVPIAMDEKLKCLRTFWADQALGFREVVGYVSKLLKKNVNTVSFDEDSFWMMDWINTVPRPNVAIVNSTQPFTAEQFVYAFNKCEAAVVMLLAKPPQFFEYRNELPQKEYVIFYYGFWLTLENLFNVKISSVDIRHSRFSSADMNTFLKHWLKDGSPQLKFLRVQVTGSIDGLYDGFEDQVVRIQKPRVFVLNVNDGETITFHTGDEIRQENGKPATIGHHPEERSFLMAIGHDFEETTIEE